MKEMSFSERLTYSTVLIKSYNSKNELSMGTGFIMYLCFDEITKEYVPVIITNNHVVANSIRTQFEFCLADENFEPIDEKTINISFDGNSWIHHPDINVDLVCFPLAQLFNNLENNNIKIFYIPLMTSIIAKQEKLVEFAAIEDVVMIGYPNGLSDEYNHKPIIRKGITATHLKNDYQGKKEFLIDMACFPGSSGSPIFVFNEGVYGEKNSLFIGGSRIFLVGILYGGPQYSAQGDIVFMGVPNQQLEPHSATLIPINLGIAIKAERLLEFEGLFPKQNKERNNGQA